MKISFWEYFLTQSYLDTKESDQILQLFIFHIAPNLLTLHTPQRIIRNKISIKRQMNGFSSAILHDEYKYMIKEI